MSDQDTHSTNDPGRPSDSSSRLASEAARAEKLHERQSELFLLRLGVASVLTTALILLFDIAATAWRVGLQARALAVVIIVFFVALRHARSSGIMRFTLAFFIGAMSSCLYSLAIMISLIKLSFIAPLIDRHLLFNTILCLGAGTLAGVLAALMPPPDPERDEFPDE